MLKMKNSPIKLLIEVLYSRKIMEWAFEKNIGAELAVRVLKNATLNVKNTKGIIIR